MQFYIVALSLPREGYYMTLHKHETPQLCKWTEADKETFLRIREQIQRLYEKGPSGLQMNRDDVEVLYDEKLTPQQASQRILPYYISCTSANKKRITYPHAQQNSIEVLGPAGTEDEDHGVRLVVIGKGVQKLSLQPWVFERVSTLRGTPFTEEEFQTLEGRSDRTLVRVLAEADQPTTLDGTAKTVVVPRDAKVRLTRRHTGEYVAQIPEIWA